MTRKLPPLLYLAVGLAVPLYAAGVKESPTIGKAPAAGTTAVRLTIRDLRAYPEQNGRSSQDWGCVLTDIVRHLPAGARYQDAFLRYTRAGDLITAGHEWTHFLNESLGRTSGSGTSSYYILDGKYVTLSDPEGLRGVVPPVPSSLRGDLFDLYLVQNSGNARIDPLYLLDEWTAYINDVTVAVDQLEEGKPLNSSDARIIQTKTAGNVLEFMFYGFAVGMAVQTYDPGYYHSENGRKLREFIILNARRSIDIYGRALQRGEISLGDPRNVVLINRFRNASDTADMRAWIRSELGEDLANTLGAQPAFSPVRKLTQARATNGKAT